VTVISEEGHMQLEFRHGKTVVRVDGDVVEIFGQGYGHRYLLPSLRVEVQPGPVKGELTIRSTSAPGDWPLYELYAKPRYQRGWVEAVIPIADEPVYRQFFTQLAQLCGRSVVA
jgi:hypothetical protein